MFVVQMLNSHGEYIDLKHVFQRRLNITAEKKDRWAQMDDGDTWYSILDGRPLRDERSTVYDGHCSALVKVR